MFIFLNIVFWIVFCIVFYLVGAGATHGYAEHRWPPNGDWRIEKSRGEARFFASFLWPFYWIFIWSLTKANEVTFSIIEKRAGKQMAKNKIRIADLRATREEIARSNAELEKAEAELESEIAEEQTRNV